MKRVLAASILGGLLILPAGGFLAPGAQAARPMDNGCKPNPKKGYKCPSSVTLRIPGQFQVHLASTSVTLTGTATKAEVGTQIFLATVSAAHEPAHATAFKVVLSGRTPALRLNARGSLYQLNVASGRWKSITAIDGNGIYAAVLK
jgi:hypothetical protein